MRPRYPITRLLGHADINVSQAYLAVFDEELVRTYRAFLSKRRVVRPDAEYREPTEQEWQEFQQHFLARKLELGECGRPYGTPCKHEHVPLTEIVWDVLGGSRCQRIVTAERVEDLLGAGGHCA